MALHGGFIPYGGTFLVFSDYARNALRMAALMQVRNIFVFTHDSIGLGEDGPTHQPSSTWRACALIPNWTSGAPATRRDRRGLGRRDRARDGPTASC
jgi:transketolase